jgi:site-specific recombinase XerD
LSYSREVRIERAIDAFLDWRRLERDAPPRSVDSYRRILWKLASDFPEARLDELTTQDLRAFLGRWRDRSASTRSNVVSVLHSFFSWAEAEDVIEMIRLGRSGVLPSGSRTSIDLASTSSRV